MAIGNSNGTMKSAINSPQCSVRKRAVSTFLLSVVCRIKVRVGTVE